MKLFPGIALLGANALYALASPQGLLGPLNIPPNLLSEYFTLLGLCNGGGANTYVGVQYQGGFETTYNFGQCYPYELPDGRLATMAVFCKTTTCFNNPNPDCTGGAVPPVPVPVPALLTLVNAADFVQIIGQGATCQKDGLS